ncbi:endonuclease/exonuclease/phosphatase family protein [Algivirga pacifica]|uniref:Endonuclease/exonuclease/phosphatase family protein n=1 Tax=Algivirga pacifica TaxID=1162670 RepID=A0ABP9D0N9_9BACT
MEFRKGRMKKLKKILYIALYLITILIAVGSLLSVFRNTESRYLKLLDFPRIQFFITSVISFILFLIFAKKRQWYDYLVAMSLIGGMVVQGSYIINYTPLVSKTVPSVGEEPLAAEDQISILLINVKMTNRNAQPALDLIARKQPDIVIAMEVDDWWETKLEPIETQYPYTQETTNSVTYGMTIFSKLPLKDVKVNYLNNPQVPSFESIVELKNGKKILLYSMHPVPPTHHEGLPDNKGQEEKAMVKLGEKIEDRNYPIIVAGDFNDVSWGATNKLTKTEDLLYDVRVGRGFYNSYHADNFLMRWPLDHVFVSKEFKLVELQRLENIDSDHFPIYVKLALVL